MPTGPPQAVDVRSESSTILALSWQPPPTESQNGIIIFYTVNITEMETGIVLSYTVVNATTLSVPALHPFYNYTCIVAAVTVGVGPYSAPAVIQMPEDGKHAILTQSILFKLLYIFYYAAPSSFPMMLTFSNISDSSFHLVWQSLPSADQNGIIRYYLVNITEVDTGRQFQLTSLATYISVGSLHPFYTYVCTVAASTVDIGPYSPPLTMKTLEAGMVSLSIT